MLSSTPMYGTVPPWMSRERAQMCGLVMEERRTPISDAGRNLDLREGNRNTQSMVDARLTSLGSIGLDRNTLIRDGLRMHGSVSYPGIRAMATEKPHDGSSTLPLSYGRDSLPDVLYKADASIDRNKATNGYLGLYKSSPAGLQRGPDGLALDRRGSGPGREKPSDLALGGGGAGGYMRLPWGLSPGLYPEAGLYPFMDSSKYAALMYKAQYLSQPSPYLPQHLAYQSLCAAQGGNMTPSVSSATERLYYMAPYPSSSISSPLVGSPMRIPAVSVAPTSMVHSQEKGLSVGPRIHHDGSPFGQQLHQPPPLPTQHLQPPHPDRDRERDRPPSRGSKPCRAPSIKGANNSTGSGGSGLPSDSSPHASSRLPQPPPLIDSTLDLQRPVPRVAPPSSSSPSSSSPSSSSQSMPHTFYASSVAPEPPSPARPSPHRPRARAGGSERRPSRSPSKPPTEQPAPPSQPLTTKDSADQKPLDLSGRLLEFGLSPNGFPVRLDAVGSPGPRYSHPSNRELLQETLSPPSHSQLVVSSTSSKLPERPEMISTLHSSWVVPSPNTTSTLGSGHAHSHAPALSPSYRPAQGKGPCPSVIKHKALERVQATPQQCSPPYPKGEGPNTTPAPSNHNHTSVLPPSTKPNGDWLKHSPGPAPGSPMAGKHRSPSEKPPKAQKRAETSCQEVSPFNKRPCLENTNGHPPGHLYLPQSEAYLPHSMAFANRYLHYSVPDGMTLHSLPLPGKGPAYPHPVLLGSSSLYPSHLAAKPPPTYQSHAGDYLTFNSQEMAHPLMHAHTDSKSLEQSEQGPKSQGQEKPRELAEDGGGSLRGWSGVETGERSRLKLDSDAGDQRGSKLRTPSKERIVCIDLVHSDNDGEATPTGNKLPLPVSIPVARGNQQKCGRGDRNVRELERESKHHQVHCHVLPHHLHYQTSPSSTHTARPGQESSRLAGEYLGPQGSTGPVGWSEESPEDQSPFSDMGDQAEQGQNTLRCARTSGDRTSGDHTNGDYMSGERTAGVGELKAGDCTSSDATSRERDSIPHNLMPGDRTASCERLSSEERAEMVGRTTSHPIHRYLDPGKERESEREGGSVGDTEESHGEGDEEEDGGRRGSRRASLAKRIANSSGYVGDRIKCVTTELYADSSKLSREQRALQMEVISQEEGNISQPASKWERAMMRFSELELKGKDCGGVSASEAGQELADGQRREREWEQSQLTARLRQGGGGRLVYGNNRVPVLQRCGTQRESLSPAQEPQDGARRCARDGQIGQCSPPILADRPPKEEGPKGAAAARKRTPSFQTKEAIEEDKRSAEKRAKRTADVCVQRAGDHATALTTNNEDEDDDVRKLKVCIELKGLCLRKPNASSPERPEVKEERTWSSHQTPPSLPRPLPPAQVPPPRDRKFKVEADVKPLAQKPEITKSWAREMLANGDAKRVGLLPSAQQRSVLMGPHMDRGTKEPRRAGALGSGVKTEGHCPSSALGDTTSLKPRRHSDTDKPKGKRACKTKHTSQRERERRRELLGGAPRGSTGLGSALENKISEPRPPSPLQYPVAPVKPCSPAACPPSLPPQLTGCGTVPPEVVGVRRPPHAEPPVVRPIPPEARRLIVNKNAGETLLQRAARLGYEEVVLYCLENRVCEVNHRDYAGYCALHEACARGWIAIVTHLLEHGADINCSAQDGTRPLHDAVENDHLDVVRVLLSYGADPTLATYSGRSLLKMTHSNSMECFLTDYFADLQGRSDDDPDICWEFYGSTVCESIEEGGVCDVLADPPGPEEADDDRKDLFEFEFSDRPLLPCYNIQVSLSQGPRNWLLLSDVLQRLRMSARTFRSSYPQMEVVTMAEAEFYHQASLSQLFSCPDELEGFHPDSKELLDLVEGSAELAALLGSTLECLDDRWDKPLEANANINTKANVNGNIRDLANAKSNVTAKTNGSANVKTKSNAKTNANRRL
ncbi:hypothetical protein UPYG_G00306580 [Umbra pygmaea]|uniref:BCL-6 corepressor n=1 Tax=Umbra pygmaea TaxID=75934 RepID=A0ABD0W394_UMBPY